MASRAVQFTQSILSAFLFILALVAFVLIGHNWYLGRSLANKTVGPTLDYGAQVAPAALRRALSLAGYGGEAGSHTHLLLYFFRPGHFQHLKSIKYGELLHQRHADKGLQVFAVTDAPPGEVETLRASESFSLPVLYDKDGLMRMLMGVQESYEHTFLINSAGEVVFSLEGAPQEDMIRQIVEKYVTGTINYGPVHAQHLYKVGEQLPTLHIAPIAGGSDFSLDARDAELVLISAQCTACQLNAYLERYRKLAASENTGVTRYVVFSQRFVSSEVATTLTTNGIPLKDFYVSRGSLGGLENEYDTKEGKDAAVRLRVDHQGLITAVKPLAAID
jgi:hypothetical protein